MNTVVAFQGSETLEITAGRTIMSKLVAPEDQGTSTYMYIEHAKYCILMEFNPHDTLLNY